MGNHTDPTTWHIESDNSHSVDITNINSLLLWEKNDDSLWVWQLVDKRGLNSNSTQINIKIGYRIHNQEWSK